MPTNVSFDEAAAVLDGPWLALNLFGALDLKNTRKIGISCVQLARHFNLEVVAVCSTRSLEVVKALGATRVIDFTQEDYTNIKDTFDAVIDAVGKSSFPKSKHLLSPKGVYLSTEFGDWIPQNPLLSLWTSIVGGKQVRFPLPRLSKKVVMTIGELVEKGKLRAVIDRRYPLEQIVEAYRYVQTGEKMGSVTINIKS